MDKIIKDSIHFAINHNRELYDECRKYKYAYKKYHAIKKIKEEYYSKELIRAYEEAEKELNKVLNELLFVLFDELGILNDFRIERTPYEIQTFEGVKTGCCGDCRTIVNGELFGQLINDLCVKKVCKENVK